MRSSVHRNCWRALPRCARSLALAAPLSPADCQVQSTTDASPAKWHLAHVTWFFETFVLERFEPGFVAHEPAFRVLFNSYYHGVGEQHPRAQRGLVTRLDLSQVIAYRAAVDERIDTLLRLAGTAADSARFDTIATLVELGIQHEQQHQELILTDVKHLLSLNPLAPPYTRSGRWQRWPRWHRAGCRSTAAWSRSGAATVTVLPSTTNARVTLSGCARTPWPTAS